LPRRREDDAGSPHPDKPNDLDLDELRAANPFSAQWLQPKELNRRHMDEHGKAMAHHGRR